MVMTIIISKETVYQLFFGIITVNCGLSLMGPLLGIGKAGFVGRVASCEMQMKY